MPPTTILSVNYQTLTIAAIGLIIGYSFTLAILICALRGKFAVTKRIAFLTGHLNQYKACLADCKPAADKEYTKALIFEMENEIEWLICNSGRGPVKNCLFYFVYWARMRLGMDIHESKWKSGGEDLEADGGESGAIEMGRKEGSLEKGVERCPGTWHTPGGEGFEWMLEKYDA